MPNKKASSKTVYRDSISGHFVPKKVAMKKPNTTEKERVYIPSPARKRK